MRRWLLSAAVVAALAHPFSAQSAEITEVLDAADGEDPIDINLDVHFRSTLNRSKITHEYWRSWTQTGRPDYNELRFSQQIYAMDYTIQIGMFHDLEFYVTLPWIIQDKKEIGWVSGVNADGSAGSTSTLYQTDPEPGFQNALDSTSNPGESPSVERGGIGDMTLGIKWAPFNDERDDTKSVWVIGLDLIIPSGRLARPEQALEADDGGVGLGQYIFTPYMLFSHRYDVLDPYVGIHASLPVQGRQASDIGLRAPYAGGFLTGLEIVPWEDVDKHQKFCLDLRLWTTFFSEVESKGHADAQGTVNELSDFLVSPSTDNGLRQLQATGQYAQFGFGLGLAFRAAEFVKLRFGVSLAHNTEHFLTGADFCEDTDGDNLCNPSAGEENPYRAGVYDNPGQRIRVEETTLFTWWVTGMLTF